MAARAFMAGPFSRALDRRDALPRPRLYRRGAGACPPAIALRCRLWVLDESDNLGNRSRGNRRVRRLADRRVPEASRGYASRDDGFSRVRHERSDVRDRGRRLVCRSSQRLKDARGGQLRSFLGILAPVGVLFCAYNLARWNTLNDIGFSLWYRVMDPRAQSGRPPFGLDNLVMQVNAFFLHGPLLTSDFPYVRAEKFGLSLAWTSPALVLSIFARSPKVDVLIFWALAIATAAPAFLYYDLGGVQLGMRHALDFAPFLIVLLMFAIRNTLVERVFWLLAIYSVLFGAYELVLWYQR